MTTEDQRANVVAAAQLEMIRWGDRPVILHLHLATLIQVIGTLQLALRYPGFKDQSTAKEIRAFIEAIEKEIPADFFGLRQIINQGFESGFD